MKTQGKITGIIMLATGIILLVWPVSTLAKLCRLLGWCMLVDGVLELIMGFSGERTYGNITGGLIALIAGVVFIANPGFIISFLPVTVGVITAIGGAVVLGRTLAQKESGPFAALSIAGGAVAVVVGLILVFKPFSAVRLLMLVLAIFLIYFGALRLGRR